MLHGQAVACKTLLDSTQTVLEQFVNFIKAGALNFCVFKRLYRVINAIYVLYMHVHTNDMVISQSNSIANYKNSSHGLRRPSLEASRDKSEDGLQAQDNTRPGTITLNCGKGFLSFAILLLCEVTTSSV